MCACACVCRPESKGEVVERDEKTADDDVNNARFHVHSLQQGTSKLAGLVMGSCSLFPVRI